MTKYRMLAALLAMAITISLAGCAANQNTADSSSEISNQTAVGVTSDTNRSDDITSETEPTKDTESAAVAEESTAERENTADNNSIPANMEKSASSAPVTNPQGDTSPASSEKPAQAEPPKQAEETKPTNPPVTPSTAPHPAEPEPTQPKPTEPPSPSFDVSAYVAYAKSYGQSIGLALDNTATACWDNPITANAKCIYLERDLHDRLDWYKASGFTAFWVWTEDEGNNQFLIYVGYA